MPPAHCPSDRAQAPELTDLQSEELESVRAAFGEHFPELARMYLADSPPRLAALYTAAAAGDCAQLAKVAHAFCGSSVSIGAARLSLQCQALELAAKAGESDIAAALLQEISAEYARIRMKLESMTGDQAWT